MSTVKSAILNYSLSNEGGKLSLVSTANFAPGGLSGPGAEVGDAFGRVQALGGSVLSRRLTAYLVGLDDTAKLEEAYKTLGAGGVSMVPKLVLSEGQVSLQTVTGRMDGWRIATPLATQPGASAESSAGLWLTPMAS